MTEFKHRAPILTAMKLTRRALIGSTLALAACGERAQGQTAAYAPLPPLKAAPFPVGTCVQTGQLSDPAFTQLLTAQFGQVTPEWEMKMEAILKDDGTFDFTGADAIAAFASARGLRLHGHTLIWYSQGGPAYERIDGQGAAFEAAYRNYIVAVAGRYRGRCVGWDVVNEPVAENGEGYRDCIWSKNMGLDYVAKAFAFAREADPTAILFLNDYNLETNPLKRRTFLALAESLLKRGAPLGGLGTQTHLSVDVPAGQVTAAIRDLASLGLPIHVSELDVSTRTGPLDLRDASAKDAAQARLVGETAEAFLALPPAQRYAFTAWGVRDQDSWLGRDGTGDRPLLFDDAGRPKAAARAFVQAAIR
jgi:endo-1,4-beta-xylanase